MIKETIYLSNPESLERILTLTGFALDELEMLVGRFAKHSHRAGQLRGKLVVNFDGSLELRKSFGNKLIANLESIDE